MGRSPEKTIESVPRDSAVKAVGIPDPLSVNMRLGQSLQRLYQPIPDEQPDLSSDATRPFDCLKASVRKDINGEGSNRRGLVFDD
jgi:hypothetical protein